MSSERHDLLQKILAAKYDLEICEERAKARMLANLNALLDKALIGTTHSRYELLEALGDKMADYRAARHRQENPWATLPPK
jgi:hypothetical protein